MGVVPFCWASGVFDGIQLPLASEEASRLAPSAGQAFRVGSGPVPGVGIGGQCPPLGHPVGKVGRRRPVGRGGQSVASQGGGGRGKH